MYLKEAFRYQNYLTNMINTSLRYIGDSTYNTKVTQEHLRKKANAEAEDETIDMTTERRIKCNAGDVVHFLEKLLDEKEKLTDAITKAKASCEIDIDAAVAGNKLRQRVAEQLSSVASIRPKEVIRHGSAYKFNADGNQMPYTYDIKEVTQIDFDRKEMKAIALRLAGEADKISSDLDRTMVSLVVEFDPAFGVNETFEDILESFL